MCHFYVIIPDVTCQNARINTKAALLLFEDVWLVNDWNVYTSCVTNTNLTRNKSRLVDKYVSLSCRYIIKIIRPICPQNMKLSLTVAYSVHTDNATNVGDVNCCLYSRRNLVSIKNVQFCTFSVGISLKSSRIQYTPPSPRRWNSTISSHLLQPSNCRLTIALWKDTLSNVWVHSLSTTSQNVKHKIQTLPKSEHIAGDVCISVVKTVITHSSPGVVVVDLKTSSIRWSVVTSESNRN